MYDRARVDGLLEYAKNQLYTNNKQNPCSASALKFDVAMILNDEDLISTNYSNEKLGNSLDAK